MFDEETDCIFNGLKHLQIAQERYYESSLSSFKCGERNILCKDSLLNFILMDNF